MENVVIVFKADNDTVDKAIRNFEGNYPEVDCYSIVTDIDEDYDASVAFYCKVEDPELTNELIRLTHHAEAIYEDSKFEYVHVEVCVNGHWFGVIEVTRKTDDTVD